jgi:hypothetical protein
MNLTVWPVEKTSEWVQCEKLGSMTGKRVCHQQASYVVAVRDPEKETELRLCRQHAKYAVDGAMDLILKASQEVK